MLNVIFHPINMVKNQILIHFPLILLNYHYLLIHCVILWRKVHENNVNIILFIFKDFESPNPLLN
jgi:hypothetical protein